LTVRYNIIPAGTGVPAVGVPVACKAGAWSAAAVAIAAAKAIAVPFWVCGFYLDTYAGGAIQVMEVRITDAAAVILTLWRIDPSLVTLNMGYFPVGPFPIAMAANAAVNAETGGAAVRTIGITMLYAVGL
jgi:hypothetical protein